MGSDRNFRCPGLYVQPILRKISPTMHKIINMTFPFTSAKYPLQTSFELCALSKKCHITSDATLKGELVYPQDTS